MTSSRTTDTSQREPSFQKFSVAQLGMYLGLASLTMFFGASLIAYLITRQQSEVWRNTDTSSVTLGMALSTVLLLVPSLALGVAPRQIASGRYKSFCSGINWSLVALAVFLQVQFFVWRLLAQEVQAADTQTLYAFSFYLLTGLHALHVVVGIVPLIVIALRARRGKYENEPRAEGLRLTRQYWDFLFLIWIVLLLCLWIFN